jgi:hypothetical protein
VTKKYVARHHVMGHCKVAPRGGTRLNNSVEERGNKAPAEDDNEDNVLRYESKAKLEPKGAATRLWKTTGTPERESEVREVGGRNGRLGSRSREEQAAACAARS